MKTRLLLLTALVAAFAALHLNNGVDADSTAITPPNLPASDSPIVFESGTERVALVELFTSQGCSSCPPADTFLSRKIRDADLWKKYVPIAWHIDYWDRLGWPDPFGSEKHTRRQYAHRNAGHVASVYTPGFVIDGREWRGFFERQDLPKPSPATNPAPNLKAKVDGKSVAVEVVWTGTAPVRASGWSMHLVELGFGLKTAIPRGENSGRTLINDFVALDHRTKAVESTPTDATFTFSDSEEDTPAPSHRAIAIWLTKAGDLTPVQATGTWLPSEK